MGGGDGQTGFSSQEDQHGREGRVVSPTENRPLRLLIVSYEYPPIGGGGASALQSILTCLSQNPQLRILLVTSSPDADAHVDRLSENITIHRLPVGKQESFYWRRAEVLRFIIAANRFIDHALEASPWDLAAAFFGFPSGLVTWRFRGRVPYLVFLRGSDVPGFNPRFQLDYLFLKPLFRRIWRASRGVVANSRLLAELAKKTCPEIEIPVLPNGVDTRRFKPFTRTDGDDRVHLVTAARLIPRKGIDWLLEALHRLGAGVSPWELHILGDGPDRERLEELARQLELADRVQFHGQAPREQMPECLAGADIFVLPSYWEGMSNALLEAMACGLPVLVTQTGGTEELVTDNGFVVQPGESDDLVAALGKMIDNPEARAEMGARSREHAVAMSWDETASEFLRICYQATGD